MEQADQTTRLVDDLLFIARADAGEPRLKVRLLSLNILLTATCADFSNQAEKNAISIDKLLKEHLPKEFNARKVE